MKHRLNIPLKSTTRHRSWRVVWLLIVIACGVAAGMFFAGLWLTRDTTSVFRPEQTDASVRLVPSVTVNEHLGRNIGGDPVLKNAPWSVSDALTWSQREISIHIANGSIIAITVDNTLSSQVKQAARLWGLKVYERKNTTLLAKQGTTPMRENMRFPVFTPFQQGDVRVYESKRRLPVRVTSKGVRIGRMHTGQTAKLPALAERVEPAAFLQTKPPFFIHSLFTDAAADSLTQLIKQHESQLFLGSDEQGNVFHLFVGTGDLDTEILARIGKEMIKRSSLSTSVLTIDEKTTVQELRIEPESIQTDLQTEENVSFLRLSNDKGDLVRITKTPVNTMFTNRDFSLKLANSNSINTCHAQAKGFVRPQKLLRILAESPGFNSPALQSTPFFTSFSEIDLLTRSIWLCW